MQQTMQFSWPTDTKQRFRRDIIEATHTGAELATFSDAGLAAILDAYPRERLGLYKFPEHAEGRVEALHGEAPDLTGAELLERVRTGDIWLNLRAVDQNVPGFSDVTEPIFDALESASGERVFKRDAGLLISSPNIHVHYHLDIPMVCLVQLRGEKTLHLYPTGEPFAPADQVEAVALREREEDITFQSQFEAAVTAITLRPGMAVTWPQNAPHRVQNSDSMNVSLSCEFMTLPALIRANAIYANGVLRRKFGASPALPRNVGAGTVGKAALARVFKVVERPPERGPTHISFKLDPAANQSSETRLNA